MKDKLLKLIYNLNYKWLMIDVILMESNPDFIDNPKGVFDEFIRRGLNKKYKFIWFVDNAKEFKDIKIKNVKFISKPGNLFDNIKSAYYTIFSKYIIDCNKLIKKKNKNQFRLFLSHGTPIKTSVNYCNTIGKIDYVIQASEYFTDVNTTLFKIDKSQVITTGLPRNDELLKDYSSIFEIYPEIKRKKLVVWFPTYRNHKNSNTNKNNQQFLCGVPSIHSMEELVKLNELLKEKEILLLIKLHPSENEEEITLTSFSNIKLIRQSFFDGHKNLYQLFSFVDAFITDYSSIYYDLLLLDKPIGLAIEDIEIYSSNNKLIFDKYEGNVIGEYIYNFDDLINYFINVSNDKDLKKEERYLALKRFHKYIDDKSSKRVVDFVLDKIEGRKNEKSN